MKVYIASPFFNEEQLERVEFIERALTRLGYDLFSPRLDTKVTPDANEEARQNAFEANVNAIGESDMIIAVTDGKDVGTIFEAGFAYAAKIPILYFAETLGDNQFNLMLAQSHTKGICLNRAELVATLKDILENKHTANKGFKGEIE